MAGGTGGHVYPALAVAKALRDKGYEPIWLGTDKGLEAKVVPNDDIQLEIIKITGLRGKKLQRLLIMPWLLLKSFIQVNKLYKVHKPVLAVGFGGYVAGPGGAVAVLKRVPLVLHEQNTVPGFTNKVLSKFAKKVCASFPNSFPGDKVIVTGNPVREDILKIEKSFENPENKPLKILVLGGSQGAEAINQVVPEAISLIAQPVKIWHQAGLAKYKKTQETYKKHQVTARVVPFIKTMSQAYEWADLVIARSGATTIAELAAVGAPSILIPYPYAVDDHQTTNAEYLAKQGGAVIMPQNTLNSAKLAEKISIFAENRSYLDEMSKKTKQLGMRDATRNVIEVCLESTSKQKE